MAQPDPARARQAALLLHALSPEAQRAALAQLDPTQRGCVQPLLLELSALGVPRELGRAIAHEEAQSHAACIEWIERAELLAPAAVLTCTEACAPSTLANLMSAREWPWKDAVLREMPARRRVAVLELMRRSSTGKLAPAMLAALCERLCRDARGHSERLLNQRSDRPDRRFGSRRWFPWMR